MGGFQDVPHIAPTGPTIFRAGAARGGHAHRECLEVIIAASGSFTVTLDDGNRKQSYLLNRPDQGLSLSTQASGERWKTSLPVRLSGPGLRNCNEEADYIYDQDEFLKYARHHA